MTKRSSIAQSASATSSASVELMQMQPWRRQHVTMAPPPKGRLVEGLVLSRAFRRVCERMHQQSVRARPVVVTRVSIRRKVTDFCDLATEFGSVLLAAERDGAVQRAEGTEGDVGACQLVARILRLVFQKDFKAGRI